MATPGKPNRSGILGALLGGLFDPENGPGQTAYEFSPEPMVGEQLSRLNPQGRDEVLSAISGRYGMGPDLEQLLGEARARYAAALESRGLGVDDYLDPETGERLRYPEVSFSNPLQRAIAMRLLEERGGDALTEIDPDYEGYRLDPKLGYGAHILPPGYADLLEAERDYDILSRMQRDPSADMSQELLMLNSGVPAYAMSDNAVPSAGMAEGYGRAYYPR